MRNRVSILFKSIFAILLVAVAVSCSEEDNIQVSASSMEMEVQGVSFTVTSNVSWTITQSGNYSFSVSPVNGVPGSTTVKVAYTPNNTGEPRNSTLSVSGGSASAAVQITQQALQFNTAQDTLYFPDGVLTKSITIQSNTEWSVAGITIPDWITSITPQQGKGNGELSITVKGDTERISEKNYLLRITYGGSLTKRIEIKQEPAYNNPPTKPVSTYPAGHNDVTLMPTFAWEPSTDVEGDELSYYVLISEDGNNWKRITGGKTTSVPLPASIGVLKSNTLYYYKVVADDAHYKGTTESDIYTFTTSDKDAYADGDYLVYMESTKANPVKLFFTGDGYLAEHFKYGGLFDKDINEAIEALFEIEPYKSYREYFTVYKIAAYSSETGITNLAENDVKNTRFRLQWEGGRSTSLSLPDSGESVFALCKTIEGVSDNDFKRSSVAVISNADVYAGTCWSWGDGKNISLITYSRDSQNGMTKFANVVRHEMGGHGFGMLGDEYQNSSESIPSDEKEDLLAWQSVGHNMNLSVYPLQKDSPWSHFEGLKEYSHVSMFEGGGYYKYGVWRPEKISCMEDNRPYYNSPSRYYIVKRILSVAKEELTMEKFIEKDVQKTDNSETKAVNFVEEFRPLGRPVLIP